MSASKGMRSLWALLVFRALSCVNFDAEAAWVGHGDLLSRKQPLKSASAFHFEQMRFCQF